MISPTTEAPDRMNDMHFENAPLCEALAYRKNALVGDNKARWHDVGRVFGRAYPIGTTTHGFNGNWFFTAQRPSWFCRREITQPQRRFWYDPGDYILVHDKVAREPAGEVFFCGDDGVVLLGEARSGERWDIGDIVIGHHDPDDYRRRQMRRYDQLTWMESGKVFTTKRHGPLEGLEPGQRFAFSWGSGATIVKLGPRVAYFMVDQSIEGDRPVDRQLTSAETKIVTR